MIVRALIYIIVLLLIGYGVALVIQGTQSVQDGLVSDRTDESEDVFRPESVTAMAAADANGVTYSGAIMLPTPCYSLDSASKVTDGGTQVRLNFTSEPGDKMCIQVVDERAFSVRAEGAKADAHVVVYFNGKKILFFAARP